MKRKQKGFSLIELIIVVLIIGIIAAIAIPNLLAARRTANESSAVASLRVLHSAQMTYGLTVGAGNYAGTVSTTGDTNAFTILAKASLIDQTLGSATKSGYTFIGGKDLATDNSFATFFFSAIPISISGVTQTGSFNYGIATDGVIRYATASTTQFDKITLSTATVLNN